jgi:hypothetical protein
MTEAHIISVFLVLRASVVFIASLEGVDLIVLQQWLFAGLD